MFDVICVSARTQSKDFLKSIELIAKSGVKSVILREKDLTENQYFELAKKVFDLLKGSSTELIIHKYISAAKQLKIKKIHLPYTDFLQFENNDEYFETVGTSVHSAEQAINAEKCGADYITAGHIFRTDCKMGLKPRGIDFLKAVCESVDIPVYAIGGIDKNTCEELFKVNSKNFKGCCVMSALMKSENPEGLVNTIKEKHMKKNREKYLLYAVTDRSWLNGDTLENVVERALQGGVTLLQLREKNLAFSDFCKEAEKIHRLCQRYSVPLIINDNVEVAKAVGAEGVHLGQNDTEISSARKVLGCEKIIGATARTVEQALRAEAQGADYIGSGAVFGTSTKNDAVKMSLDTFREICSSVSIPVTAIGGITKNNILELRGLGASGVAVVSGIFAEKDIYDSTLELKKKAEVVVYG